MGLYVGWVMGDLWAPPALFFLPIPVFFAGVAGRGRSDGAELP